MIFKKEEKKHFRQKLFAIYDSAIGQYLMPHFAESIGAAQRSFEDACKDGNTILNKHPAHFTLFQIGAMDPDSGDVINVEPNTYIITALEVAAKIQNQPSLPFDEKLLHSKNRELNIDENGKVKSLN